MPTKSLISLTLSYRFAVGGSHVMKEMGCNAKIERKRNRTILETFFDAYCRRCMSGPTLVHVTANSMEIEQCVECNSV